MHGLGERELLLFLVQFGLLLAAARGLGALARRVGQPIDSMVMGVFAPVFFAYSGLQVRTMALPGWPITLLVLGGAILGKVVGAGVGARLGGMRTREALAVGIGLSARGSTELVVARLGMELGVLAAPMVLLGSTPRYVGQRAFFGPTIDLVLARAPCAVAVYAGGVRPAALRAAAPAAAGAAAGPPAPATT